MDSFYIQKYVLDWKKKIGVPKQKIKIKFIYWINKN